MPSLTDLIEELVDEWAERFADAGICFSSRVDISEFWIEADYLALKRLFGILLENAWRYTPSGQSVTITLKDAHGPNSGVAEVNITDTGIGITPEDQKRIFDRFYRVARPFRGNFSGSGLGLALGQ